MAMNLPSGRGRGRRAPMADINVTPMVDVMLVLLIIFMVTAPLMTAGVPVNLPDARGAEGIVTLRRQLPDVPITMISADMDGAMIGAAMAAGEDLYRLDAGALAGLVAHRLRHGGELLAPTPLYLRQPDAKPSAGQKSVLP